MTKIHHHIVTVLKSPLVAFGIIPKPKTKPVITVPAAKSANIAAHIWEDHVYATREPAPTPPPSRLVLSETDEVAIPYEPVMRKSAKLIQAEREFKAYLDEVDVATTSAKHKVSKPAIRAKAKARAKDKVAAAKAKVSKTKSAARKLRTRKAK